MAQRHSDAVHISQGACNPSAIAIAITNACREIRAEPNHTGTAQITSDPAIRLMVHQLAYICGLSAEMPNVLDYGHALDACEKASQMTVPAVAEPS